MWFWEIREYIWLSNLIPEYYFWDTCLLHFLCFKICFQIDNNCKRPKSPQNHTYFLNFLKIRHWYFISTILETLETVYMDILAIFQDGIKLLFSHWTCICCKSCRCFFADYYSVDIDVVRFVFEMKNRWFYIYHITRNWLMILDRVVDFLAILVFIIDNSKPFWCVSLGIYITLRLLSFAEYVFLCCHFECYTVRTVLLFILSIFCLLAIVILESDDISNVLPYIGFVFALGPFYAPVFYLVHSTITFP